MSTIKAYAATSAKGPLTPYEFEPGPLGDEDIEIAVSHCGICHSDLSMLDNEWGMSQFPFVPGHEAVGTIVALGEHAKGLKIGQRVGVGWSRCALVIGAVSSSSPANPRSRFPRK